MNIQTELNALTKAQEEAAQLKGGAKQVLQQLQDEHGVADMAAAMVLCDKLGAKADALEDDRDAKIKKYEEAYDV